MKESKESLALSDFNEQFEDPTNLDELAEQLIVGFDPENSAIDRRILFEITGIRHSPDDFQDSSSEDNDPLPNVT